MPAPKPARDRRLRALAARGVSLADLAKRFRLSRVRVYQIVVLERTAPTALRVAGPGCNALPVDDPERAARLTKYEGRAAQGLPLFE